jgi:hypothetical protein
MKSKYMAKLEKHMEDFINDECEEMSEDDAEDCFFYDDLSVDMAKAAEAIFDASMKAQKFFKEQ